MIDRIQQKLKRKVNMYFRSFIDKRNIKRLKNKNFTLIASNCTGCRLSHELNLRFNSPFVNLYIEADDFVKLLHNFDYYMGLELEFIESDRSYPVAVLGDIKIYFVHYKDEEHARTKWNERKNRMDMSNVYVIFLERDGCTKQTLQEFDKVPFEHKVVFTREKYSDIKSCYCIKEYEGAQEVGSIYEFTGWNGKRIWDQFDFVSWLNNKN